VPNGFGSGLGTVQLILYAIYRKNKGEPRKASDGDRNSSLEMDEKDHKAIKKPNSNQFDKIPV
ncbi:hypothetical protein CRG98_022122, partial [Punica granatum]